MMSPPSRIHHADRRNPLTPPAKPKSDSPAAGGGSELLMPIIVNGHYGASDGDEEGQQATVLV